jgi:hypothetical protein
VPGLQSRPLIEPEVCRTVSLVTVRGRPHSPAVGAFVRAAKSYRWHDALQQREGLPAPGDARSRRSRDGGLAAELS